MYDPTQLIVRLSCRLVDHSGASTVPRGVLVIEGRVASSHLGPGSLILILILMGR
jgi:hypothetical protein